MAMVSFKSLATISRETWTPSKSVDGSVWHYSIPNFDTGMAHLENTSSIMSNKFLITKPCVLISKLNPKSPRVWLIENVQEETSVCSTEFIVLTPNSPADLRFLYFLLKSSEVRQRLSDIATGTSSSHQRVRPEDILNLEVECLDSVIERQNCSNVLMALESRISLNVEIAKTLEEIAQTIFKSWFIDFDPVKAKMAGEKPVGMDDATAALFPDALEDSELGAIPSGWSVGALGHHLIVSKGKSYKSSELVDSDTALVTLKSFLRGGGYRHDGLKPFSGEYKPEQIIEPGELIVSYTDVTQAADVIGKPALVMPDSKFSKLVASLDIGIVRPRSQAVGKSFLYQLFLTPRFKHHIDGYTNGTTVLHLGKGALEEFKAVLPTQELMRQYENFVGIFSSQAQLLSLENFGLTTLRDSLLPRLISGELQIPEEMLVTS